MPTVSSLYFRYVCSLQSNISSGNYLLRCYSPFSFLLTENIQNILQKFVMKGRFFHPRNFFHLSNFSENLTMSSSLLHCLVVPIWIQNFIQSTSSFWGINYVRSMEVFHSRDFSVWMIFPLGTSLLSVKFQ